MRAAAAAAATAAEAAAVSAPLLWRQQLVANPNRATRRRLHRALATWRNNHLKNLVFSRRLGRYFDRLVTLTIRCRLRAWHDETRRAGEGELRRQHYLAATAATAAGYCIN